MRELKLKYFVELVSNLGTVAKGDAKQMTDAQAAVAKAVGTTNTALAGQAKEAGVVTKATTSLGDAARASADKVSVLDRALSRVGTNTAAQRQTTYLQTLGRSLDATRDKALAAGHAIVNGMSRAPEMFAAGAGAAYGAKAFLTPPVRAFTSLESAETDFRISIMRKGGGIPSQYDAIRNIAKDLGNKLPGTTADFTGAATALASQGVSLDAIAHGGLQSAAYLGVLLKMHPAEAAETVAKLREAYSLHDDQLPGLADEVQRNRFAFGLTPEGIKVAASYAGPSLNTLGLGGLDNLSRILTLQGMANQKGMDPSTFGTNFAMMLSQLVKGPMALENAKHGMKADARRLLEENHINFDFFDKDGHLNTVDGDPVKALVMQLSKLQGLRNKKGQPNEEAQLEVASALFGQEAARPALILSQYGVKGYEAALDRKNSQAGLDERIAELLGTLASKMEALGGTITNLMAQMATQLAQGAKGPIDKVNDWLGGGVQSFFENHPAAGTAGLIGGAGLSSWLTGKLGMQAWRSFFGGGAGAAESGASNAGKLLWPELEGAASSGGGLLARLGPMLKLSPLAMLGDLGNMTSEGDMRMLYDDERKRKGWYMGGSGFVDPRRTDLLSITAPGNLPTSLPQGGSTEIKIGEGKIDVNVRVTDERVTANTNVTQQLAGVKLNSGNTDPAGYMGR